jgi:very-short-patch-repair endonuclease
MNDLDDAAGRVASRQHGVLTRGQAVALGLTPSAIERRRRSGRWISVERGVYRINGAPETWHSRLIALCFAFDGVASHRSAAALLQVDGFRFDLIEISVAVGRRVERPGVVMHECTDLHLFDPQVVRGIPTTPIDRLVVDLGSVVRFERYDLAVDDMIRRKVLTWDRALDQLIRHARRGRNGVGALRALLDERYQAGVGDTVLEGAFIRELHRRALLEPVPQLKIYDSAGRFIARVDYAYPDLKIAIELDSLKYHGDPIFESDRDKRLRLTVAGWIVIEVTWKMLVGNPDEVFRRLISVMRDQAAKT